MPRTRVRCANCRELLHDSRLLADPLPDHCSLPCLIRWREAQNIQMPDLYAWETLAPEDYEVFHEKCVLADPLPHHSSLPCMNRWRGPETIQLSDLYAWETLPPEDADVTRPHRNE